MGSPYNENLQRVLGLSRQLLELAENGDRERSDTECAELYGAMREMAHKLKKLAEQECERHKNKGVWDL